KNLDAITRLFALPGPKRIFVKLQHPEPAAFIPCHGHRIDHLGFGSEETNFKTGQEREFLLRLLRGEGRGEGRRVLPDKLFAGRLIRVNRKIKLSRSAWSIGRSGPELRSRQSQPEQKS